MIVDKTAITKMTAEASQSNRRVDYEIPPYLTTTRLFDERRPRDSTQ